MFYDVSVMFICDVPHCVLWFVFMSLLMYPKATTTTKATAHSIPENWDDEEQKAQEKLAEIKEKKEAAAVAAKLLADKDQKQKEQAKDYQTANTLQKKYMSMRDDLTVLAHHDLMFLHFYVVV